MPPPTAPRGLEVEQLRAIHVYGGEFFAAERSEWDPETLAEGRYYVARAMRLFEDANRTAAAAGSH